MRLLLVSPPDVFRQETSLVREMLALGLPRFHVRKPTWDKTALLAYFAEIPACFHSRLVLHSHHSLVRELGLGGAHLTAAARAAGARPQLVPGQTLSTSFHTLAEIRRHRRRYDYDFLSPIFDSLSKANYPTPFDMTEVAGTLQQLQQRPGYVPQVVALGGVEAHRLEAVRQAGFAGAAVLGAVWQSPDPVAAFRALQARVG